MRSFTRAARPRRPLRSAVQAILGTAAAGASLTLPTSLPAASAAPATPASAASRSTSLLPPATSTASGPTLGVLGGLTAHLSTDKAAGVKTATILVHWSQAEPNPGQWNLPYLAYVGGMAHQYREAGMNVAVDPGLQTPPGWVTGAPEGAYLDQNGASSPLADFAWSRGVRSAGAAYLDKLVSTMGTVVDYRVGTSENGEAMLPNTATNQWWAYTPTAQARAVGLPVGVLPSPMPGWVPGTPTWNGQPVTVDQATAWYDWYFSGLSSQLAWEINTFRAAGYLGQLELVMPGMGSLPQFYNERVDHLLADGKAIGQNYDDFYTLNRGAVWWKLLSSLPNLTNVAVDVSSVDDVSGSPRANGCAAGDASVPYTSSAIWSWSDTRWLAYLAHAHGLAVMGENPGNTPAANLPAIMNLVHSCNLTALQWAWDRNLYANDGSATLAQLHDAFYGAS